MINPALIAAGNHKGGCGKTTSLCNLGRRAQQRGL
jgi:cellulose biosynthesis protein BcsQ